MPIVARARVNADVKAAIDCYLDEDAMNAAMGFNDASERSYAHIDRYPAPVSSRYAREVNLPRLRAWKLTRYLYRA